MHNLTLQQQQQVAMRNMQQNQMAGNMQNMATMQQGMGNMSPLQWARHVQQQQSRGQLPQGTAHNLMVPNLMGSNMGSTQMASPMASQNVKNLQPVRPFVVGGGSSPSPELDLMASCSPLPNEATAPLPESVMN